MERHEGMQFGIGLSQLVALDENVRLAQLAEEVGFSRVSCADNLLMRPVWPILALVAEHTRRVEIGPLVSHPYLTHPAMIAGCVAELDELSGGRAFMGIGRGAFYEQVCLDPPKPMAGVRDAVEIFLRLLRGDRRGYRGEVFSLAEGAGLRWQPPRREVPIVVGTWGPKLAEIAGELAHEVDVGFLMKLDHIRVVKEHLERGARRAGRDAGRMIVSVGALTAVAADRAAALTFARHHLSLFLPVLTRIPEFPPVDPAERVAVEAALERGGPQEAAPHVKESTVAAYCLAGTPEDLIPKIEGLAAAGVRHLTFCPPLGPDREEAIRLLGAEVLPRFRSR